MRKRANTSKTASVELRREPGTSFTPQEKAQLRRLADKPETEIDTSDIPEWTDEMFRRAVRAPFYRPIKKAVSLRLDSDILAWLKKDGQGYQTRANLILRERMLKDLAG